MAIKVKCVAIYVRTAVENDAEVQKQLTKLTKEVFLDWGYDNLIMHIYIDNGFSEKDPERPAYVKMNAHTKHLKFTHIYCVDISPSSRSTQEFAKLSYSKNRRASIVSLG